MSYRFILGVGRGGTTLLGRLMALSKSKMRFVIEPLPRVKKILSNKFAEPWFVPPIENSAEAGHMREILLQLSMSENIIREEIKAETIERNDENYEYLLIKEVHALLAFPLLLSEFDFKAVVITRDITRVLDSFFSGHLKHQRKYLVDDYRFMHSYIKSGKETRHVELLEKTISEMHPNIINYLRRPIFLTNEVFRMASIVAIINKYLKTWAQANNQMVTHVSFEELCLNPVTETERLFKCLDLQYDDTVLDKVLAMTRNGSDTGYYDTRKNGLDILGQEYKYFDTRLLNKLKTFLSE